MEENNMRYDFPEVKNKFFKTKDFANTKITLTYKGWDYVPNEDEPKRNLTWKDKLDWQLTYSFPEYVLDKHTGERVLSEDDTPWKNKNYKPEYPRGYAIKYLFNEGELTSGSWPLFRGFCTLRPKVGEKIVIGKVGEKMETVWTVCHPGEEGLPMTGEQLPDYKEGKPDESLPF